VLKGIYPDQEKSAGSFFLYFLPTGTSEIFDCLGNSHIKSVGDERMANGYLFDARKLLEAREVVKVEIVSSVELHSRIKGRVVGLAEPGELSSNISFGLSGRVRPRVKLDTICTESRSPCHVSRLWIHEKAYTDTFCPEAFDGGTKGFLVFFDVPTLVRGNLTQFNRNESALGGMNLHNQVEEIGSGISLDVKLDCQHSGEIAHVTGTNVALVLSGMDSDALASCLDAGTSGLDDVRFIATPGIAQSCDLVDVDTEVYHVSAPLAFA
jgi:hypothetical protein